MWEIYPKRFKFSIYFLYIFLATLISHSHPQIMYFIVHIGVILSSQIEKITLTYLWLVILGIVRCKFPGCTTYPSLSWQALLVWKCSHARGVWEQLQTGKSLSKHATGILAWHTYVAGWGLEGFGYQGSTIDSLYSQPLPVKGSLHHIYRAVNETKHDNNYSTYIPTLHAWCHDGWDLNIPVRSGLNEDIFARFVS